MREHRRTTREAEEFDDLETDEELLAYLHQLAPQIGWVIIYFNSLEDTVSYCLRELMLRDPIQDERLDVFLAEMLFAAKSRSLVHLYGQIIETSDVRVTRDELAAVERLLEDCAKRRNEYAHADWIGLKRGLIVKVKSQSKKRGIIHRYKRFEAADVKEDVAFIDAARDALYEFHARIDDQLQGTV